MRRALGIVVALFLLAWGPVAFAKGYAMGAECSRVILWDEEPPRSTPS